MAPPFNSPRKQRSLLSSPTNEKHLTVLSFVRSLLLQEVTKTRIQNKDLLEYIYDQIQQSYVVFETGGGCFVRWDICPSILAGNRTRENQPPTPNNTDRRPRSRRQARKLVFLMKIYSKIISEWNSLLLFVSSYLKTKESVSLSVPYVCQFASPEYAEKVLKDKEDPKNDPNWENAGALSPERYGKWATSACGMACTSMALKYFNNDVVPLVKLAEDALSHEVYSESDNGISGMEYYPYPKWIKKHGIQAKFFGRMNVKGIQHLLSKGNLVIVSVNPNIRGCHIAPTDQVGGHLIIAHGYDKNRQTVTISNPSGFVSLNSQSSHVLPVSEFQKYFAGRGISLKSI